VPDDVALVGFNDREIVAVATWPPLATVDPNLHALGCLAGEMLMRLRSRMASSASSSVSARNCMSAERGTECSADKKHQSAENRPTIWIGKNQACT
jgi:hypothetical protein